MVMMWVSIQMSELFFVVPSQNRHISEGLIGIIDVSVIIVNPHLETDISRKLRSQLEEDLISRKRFALDLCDVGDQR